MELNGRLIQIKLTKKSIIFKKNINVEEVEDTDNTEIITYNRRILSKHFLFIILV